MLDRVAFAKGRAQWFFISAVGQYDVCQCRGTLHVMISMVALFFCSQVRMWASGETKMTIGNMVLTGNTDWMLPL